MCMRDVCMRDVYVCVHLQGHAVTASDVVK